MNLKFVSLKTSYCKKCGKTTMHEYGNRFDGIEKYVNPVPVKQCIVCNEVTDLKKDEN